MMVGCQPALGEVLLSSIQKTTYELKNRMQIEQTRDTSGFVRPPDAYGTEEQSKELQAAIDTLPMILVQP